MRDPAVIMRQQSKIQEGEPQNGDFFFSYGFMKITPSLFFLNRLFICYMLVRYILVCSESASLRFH